MWTLGRRSAAGLLPRSALAHFAHTGAGAARPVKNIPLSGHGDLRSGTAGACVSSHAVSTRQAPRSLARARRRWKITQPVTLCARAPSRALGVSVRGGGLDEFLSVKAGNSA